MTRVRRLNRQQSQLEGSRTKRTCCLPAWKPQVCPCDPQPCPCGPLPPTDWLEAHRHTQCTQQPPLPQQPQIFSQHALCWWTPPKLRSPQPIRSGRASRRSGGCRPGRSRRRPVGCAVCRRRLPGSCGRRSRRCGGCDGCGGCGVCDGCGSCGGCWS